MVSDEVVGREGYSARGENATYDGDSTESKSFYTAASQPPPDSLVYFRSIGDFTDTLELGTQNPQPGPISRRSRF